MNLAQEQQKLYDAVSAASHDLRAIKGIGSGPLGLTPQAVKQSPEYIAAKRNYEHAFSALRSFNAKFANTLRLRA